MSSDFDPYYLWLGIPPHEQPPNHYRLLGIALYESNASVIDSAASRQSTYLHSVAAGPQRQASQKLLTEIAAARRTLLSAESKPIYDAELKARLEPVVPKAALLVARPVGVPVAAPVAAPIATAVAAPVAIPVAAPVAPPVAAPLAPPVAAPVVAPIAAPVAIPVAAPIAAPVATPIAAPIAVPAPVPPPVPDQFEIHVPIVEPEPMADLFGNLDAEPSHVVEPPPVTTPTVATASEPVPAAPPAAAPAAARLSTRQMVIAGGGVGLLVLILAIVFWPKGRTEKEVAAPEKSKTTKKSKSATAANADDAKPRETASSPPVPTGKRHVRMIRIELPRKGVLSIAEVETIYDNRNVAAYGATAEQSSTEGAAAAALAIDGKTSGKSGDKTHSQTKDTDKPWWQLDLGGAYPLEKIVIHNCTDPGAAERMAGFKLILMDKWGGTVVELVDQPAPSPKTEFLVNSLVSNAPPAAAPAPTKPKSAETKKPKTTKPSGK